MQTYNVSSSYVYGSSRCGFNHFGTLTINGVKVAESKCHYINRTWEPYSGRSARVAACERWLENRTNEHRAKVRETFGIKVIRAKSAAAKALAEMARDDREYQAVLAHRNSL